MNEIYLTTILATVYSFIEFIFTNGHTTVEQWFTNLTGIPIFILWNIQYMQGIKIGTNHYIKEGLMNPIIVILMFPFTIWTLEIFEGIWLELWNQGVNPAWEYDTGDSRFGGKIRFGYWIHWLLMGAGLVGTLILAQS